MLLVGGVKALAARKERNRSLDVNTSPGKSVSDVVSSGKEHS